MATAVALAACGQNAALYDPSPAALGAAGPDSFVVAMETSEGYLQLRMHRAWSPLAVDRVYHLMNNDFYAGARIYRMVPGFVAQWGFSGDPELDSAWRGRPVDDEPTVASNTRGTVSFASAGPRTRSYTLFINLDDNSRLDSLAFNGVSGFPPVGVVETDVGVADGFYSAYDMPATVQDSIEALGNDYLRRVYPQLDSIISTRVVATWR